MINPNKYQIKKYNIVRKIKLEYETQWYQSLNATQSKSKNKGGNKLRTYNQMKQHFTLEPYLEHIDNIIHRKSVTRIRLSSHPLNIESMRMNTPNPQDRICHLCNTKEIEDEEHFIMNCAIYKFHRDDMLQSCLSICPNFTSLNNRAKFLYLLTNENKIILKALGKFICLSLETRQNKSKDTQNPVTV